MKNYILSNGIKIPCLGLGTWMIENEKVEEVVKNAIDLGYRHIDTAQAYENEEGVGRAINNSTVKREELFITTKVRAEYKTYDEAKASIEASLKRMNLDYIDLVIIHSPQPWNEFREDKRYFKENVEVWRALEDEYKEGKVRAIGVSNFLIDDLKNILENSRIKPMVNQILAHISNTDLELIKYCEANAVLVEAYSPIAHGEALKNEKIIEMANKYNVSVAQLCIKYTLQLNMVSLPKASSIEHLKDNMTLDFEITDEDMEILKNLDKIENYGEYSHFPVFGKSN